MLLAVALPVVVAGAAFAYPASFVRSRSVVEPDLSRPDSLASLQATLVQELVQVSVLAGLERRWNLVITQNLTRATPGSALVAAPFSVGLE